MTPTPARRPATLEVQVETVPNDLSWEAWCGWCRTRDFDPLNSSRRAWIGQLGQYLRADNLLIYRYGNLIDIGRVSEDDLYVAGIDEDACETAQTRKNKLGKCPQCGSREWGYDTETLTVLGCWNCGTDPPTSYLHPRACKRSDHNVADDHPQGEHTHHE